MKVTFFRDNIQVHEEYYDSITQVPGFGDYVAIDTRGPPITGKVEKVAWHYSMTKSLNVWIYLV